MSVPTSGEIPFLRSVNSFASFAITVDLITSIEIKEASLIKLQINESIYSTPLYARRRVRSNIFQGLFSINSEYGFKCSFLSYI